MKLKQLKPKLNFIKNNVRPILSKIKVTSNSLQCTDLETFVTIKDNHDMHEGLQNYATLGMTDSLPDDSQYPPSTVNRDYSEHLLISMDKLERCLQFASKDETRLHLNGVAINKGHLLATDGHTMKYFKTDRQLENDYILPRASLTVLIKLLKGYKLTGLVSINLNESWATVDNSHFTLSMRLIQREYPKWQYIIPVKFNHTVAIENFNRVNDFRELFKETRSHACRLVGKEGIITIVAKNYPNDPIEIGVCDHDFEIGFNFDYLVRAANKRNEFGLKYNSELKPCEVNEAIVMPLKL